MLLGPFKASKVPVTAPSCRNTRPRGSVASEATRPGSQGSQHLGFRSMAPAGCAMDSVPPLPRLPGPQAGRLLQEAPGTAEGASLISLDGITAWLAMRAVMWTLETAPAARSPAAQALGDELSPTSEPGRAPESAHGREDRQHPQVCVYV